jgi:TldD protein
MFLIRAVQDTLEGRADYYDLRKLDVSRTELEMKKNEVTKAVSGRESGACVRVLYRGAWGFASTPEADEKSLADAADRAARMAKGVSKKLKEKAKLATVKPASDNVVIPMKKSFLDMSMDAKLEVLRETYDAVKEYDFIANSTAS